METYLLLMQQIIKNTLENIKITELDENYNLLNTIVSDRADINRKLWNLTNVKIYSQEKNRK